MTTKWWKNRRYDQVREVQRRQVVGRIASFGGCSQGIVYRWWGNSFQWVMDSRVDCRIREQGKYQERAWWTEPNWRHGCVQAQGRASAHQRHCRSPDAMSQGPSAQVSDRRVIPGGAAPQERWRCHTAAAICTWDEMRIEGRIARGVTHCSVLGFGPAGLERAGSWKKGRGSGILVG